MHSTNFIFLPYHNTGGHFILWSLYFVTGSNVAAAGDKIVPVLDAPEQFSNFHHQAITHISGFDNCKKHIDAKVSSELPINVYLSQTQIYQLIKDLYNVSFDQATPDQVAHVKQVQFNDTKKLINLVQDQNYPLIMIDYAHADHLNIIYNDRNPTNFNSDSVTAEQMWNGYEEAFFKNAISAFDSNIWDQREKMAITIPNPEKQIDYYQLFDKQKPHLYYNTDDVWNDLPNVLREMCCFLNLSIDSVRYAHWLDVYHKWRYLHDPYFARHFKRIVQAIVDNEYVRLDRFKMNFYKEMLIQRSLILDYNLNLKTWQLEKFPTNTQDLHKLLEANIHTI